MKNLTHKPKIAQVVLLKVETMFKAGIMKSGLYNWHKALEGEFCFYKDIKGRLSDYDILLVICDRSAFNHRLISKMRQELGEHSDTLIVASMDYAVELWQDSTEIALFEHEIGQADHIFVSEPANQSYLTALLPEWLAAIPIIAHPLDVKNIKELRKPAFEKEKSIFSVLHKWETNWLAVYLAGRDHPGCSHSAVFTAQPNRPDMISFFDEILPPYPSNKFPEWMEWMSKKYIYLEPYHMIHTFGRTVAECAALGLCCVGSDCVDAISVLYPDLVTRSCEVDKQRQVIRRLLNEPEFYEHCSSLAIERVESYSYASKRREFMELIGYDESTIQGIGNDAELPRPAKNLG